PAWSPDGSRLLFGSDASGVWEISSVDARGAEKAATVTRVTGGAFSPAEAPDGRSIFFLELTAKGVDLRRLPFPAEPVEALPRSAADFPILPPLVLEPKRFEESLLPAPHAYRPFSTETLLPASGFTMGPSGNSYQTGVEGSDVVGQLDWMALGAFGNAAGPRGGSLAGSWSGLPAKLTIQFFSALEKPGSQRLAPRPELDEERRGFFAGASWGRPYDGGAVALDVGGGWTRVEDLTEDRTFSRTVGSARLSGGLRRTRGSLGYAVSGQLQGSLGNTAGGFWSQYLAEAKVSGITGVATLSFSARYGDTGGSPTPFDIFQIGGAESSILPSGLDRNRVPSPSLPAALQFGDRLESYRADLGLRAIPLVVYAESLRAWNPTLPRPDGVRVGGAELRLERLLPEELRPNGLSFYAGVARIRSEDPHLSTTQGYGGFVFHP
ncbi:MAG TPA: hypothetical protein VEG84_09285, partial [Thermoanaerobaculia bacterium]|nr:hypothetical protein [Thermoanaerobaculia bacterium]